MADISKINLSGAVYNIKDATARANLNEIQSISSTEIDEITDLALESLPSSYVYNYDTVADMQADISLQEGMTCHTNGFHASGDGGAAYYTVSASGTANGIDVLVLQNSLYAHQLMVDTGFYSEVAVKIGRVSDTDYYLTTVPVNDAQGNTINLYLDYDANKNPLEQADYNHTTLTVNGNASLLIQEGGESVYRHGISISNGVVLNTRSMQGLVSNYPLYIGIKADRSIAEYVMNSDVTPTEMLNDGCLNVFNCYFKLVSDSVIADVEQITVNGNTYTSTERNPLMVLGVKPTNELVFLACDGRTEINAGLTYSEAAEILIAEGCTDAYNLDGGGSTCMVLRGSKLNRDIDSDGTAVRLIKYTLNVKKHPENFAVQEAFAKIGVEKQRLIEQLIPYINNVKESLTTSLGTLIPNNSDLNDYLTGGKYYCGSAANAATIANSPVTTRGYDLYVLPQGSTGRSFTQILIANVASDGKVYIYTRSVTISSDGQTLTASTWYRPTFYDELASLESSVQSLQGVHTIITVGPEKTASFTTPTRAIVVYAIGSQESGIDFLYVNNSNLTTVRVVQPTASALEPTYSRDAATNIVTMTNASNNLYIRGIVIAL